MGLLTPNQQLFAKQMSRIVINEDESFSEAISSQEEDQSNLSHEFLLRAVNKMARSKNKTDQRFIDFFKTSQAWVYGAVFKDFRDLSLVSDAYDYDGTEVNADSR